MNSNHLEVLAMPSKICTVLIVDDHDLMREGLHTLLKEVPNLKVIAEAGNGQDAIALCHTLHPSIVLMDLSLPELDGIEAILQIHRCFPSTRILALTASATEVRAADALNAGALGYVLKRSGKKELLRAIDTVLPGGLYLDPALNERQVIALMASTEESRRFALTRREKQVLKLIAQGDRNRDIANKLVISLKTVETHRLNLMHKLDAHNAAKLTCWAYRLGVLNNEV